ncbi:MAG: MerR family transcriptional regulator [Endomicrobiales bacterium]|nr:MerR family transcriptional regulator [Endomicrobiales bacterium]
MIEIPPLPDKEFFSIGEVSQIAQLPAYVLRYWENEFRLLRPARRVSGQRKYIKRDIEAVFQIKDLLYNKKFTIAGAKKALIGDKRRKEEPVHQLNLELGKADKNSLAEIKTELEEILKLLK